MASTGIPPRTTLATLLDLMEGSRRSHKRDKCGDSLLVGRRGHLYVNGEGFLLYLAYTGRRKAWTFAKRKLARFQVAQDGDDEGCLQIINPTAAEARMIRRLLGIRQRQPAHVADNLSRR